MLFASDTGSQKFVDINVAAYWWIGLLVLLAVLLLVDLLVVHRESHEVKTREAAIESGGDSVAARPVSTTPAISSRKASVSTTCSCGR